MKFAADNGFGYYQVLTRTSLAADGSWHHLAAVRQEAALTVYLDGLPQPTAPSGNAAPPLNRGPLSGAGRDQGP